MQPPPIHTELERWASDRSAEDATAADVPPNPTAAEATESDPLSSSVNGFQLAIFDDHLRSIALQPGTMLVGRSQHSHLTLHDSLLSRKHCSLNVSEHGVTLSDLNSSNGTFVNGKRIASLELAKDDIIELGKTVMVFVDGASWDRGEGLVQLRNPVKAQELIQSLREGIVKRTTVTTVGASRNGVRAQKGLTDRERAFMRWLEMQESPILPELVTDYLTHKLVSLLVRNSNTVRGAFTSVLEGMMRPDFVDRFTTTAQLRAAIAELVKSELERIRGDGEPADTARDLLEVDDDS